MEVLCTLCIKQCIYKDVNKTGPGDHVVQRDKQAHVTTWFKETKQAQVTTWFKVARLIIDTLMRGKCSLNVIYKITSVVRRGHDRLVVE